MSTETEIVTFLRARLDEDEREAWDSTPGEWIVTHDPLGVHVENGDGRGRVVMCSGDDRRDGRGAQNATHIARHDPARVLREIAGKRGIVELQLDRAVSELPDEVLLHLAEAYSDHPDYRQEWKP